MNASGDLLNPGAWVKSGPVFDHHGKTYGPGSVVFVETPEGVTHRDYVTHAWTENPVKEVLVKMAATPAFTRVATSSRTPANQ